VLIVGGAHGKSGLIDIHCKNHLKGEEGRGESIRYEYHKRG